MLLTCLAALWTFDQRLFGLGMLEKDEFVVTVIKRIRKMGKYHFTFL